MYPGRKQARTNRDFAQANWTVEKTRNFPEDRWYIGLELVVQIFPEHSYAESCMLIPPSNLNLRPRVFCTVYDVSIDSECYHVPCRFRSKAIPREEFSSVPSKRVRKQIISSFCFFFLFFSLPSQKMVDRRTLPSISCQVLVYYEQNNFQFSHTISLFHRTCVVRNYLDVKLMSHLNKYLLTKRNLKSLTRNGRAQKPSEKLISDCIVFNYKTWKSLIALFFRENWKHISKRYNISTLLCSHSVWQDINSKKFIFVQDYTLKICTNCSTLEWYGYK